MAESCKIKVAKAYLIFPLNVNQMQQNVNSRILPQLLMHKFTQENLENVNITLVTFKGPLLFTPSQPIHITQEPWSKMIVVTNNTVQP